MLTAGVSVAIAVWTAMGAVRVADIGAGNALTLPAQRHLVRVAHPDGTASLLLALQQDGAGGHGLGFYRSDDEGRSWYRAAGIQDDFSHRDTADVLPLGQDLGLVYSYEGSSLAGSVRHDVSFQRWRYLEATRSFAPDPPVLVFNSTSSQTGFYRAEIAEDSLGRLWVQAFALQADGTHLAVIAVSLDGGQSFSIQPALVTLPSRGGGRLLRLGDRLLFLFDQHDDLGPARFMVRQDSAPLASWGPIQTAFSEGIYHGAALSAVATASGQMHLVYKAETDEKLWYRLFDGAGFGPPLLVDDAGWWASQANATLVGDDLYVFYSRPINPEVEYEIRARIVRGGVAGAPAVVDSTVSFKGYPAAADRLPPGVSSVPCAFGFTADANSAGEARVVFVSSGDGDPGTPDAGPPPAPPPPPPGTLLFADDFNRTAYNLGSEWKEDLGLWMTRNSYAASDLDGPDLAHELPAACRDCKVEAAVVGFGVPETALVLRAQSAQPADRYDLVLLSTGRIRIRRHLGGSVTVLGEAPSGVVLNQWATLGLSAVGAGPVRLTASVNGAVLLSAVDSSPGPLAQAGHGGLWATRAGVAFDTFRLTAQASWPEDGGSPPDAGSPGSDGGTADAGVPDAGAPDAGTPDAGTPRPDGGTLALTPVLTNTTHEFLAVGVTGTAYAVKLGESRRTLHASTDFARSWSPRTTHTGSFMQMTTLQSGVLVADVSQGGRRSLARSADDGRTWQNVVDLGQYKMLTPHSIAELNGQAFFAEYQSFTSQSAPIRLWVSADQGRTWSVRHTFTGHRHAHGIRADPSRNALWVFFGDTTAQSGVYRSTDEGRSWIKMLGNQQGDVVDAIVTPEGLLFGQDISYLPDLPHIATLSFDGVYRALMRISGPAYSSYPIRSGGFLVGAAREPGGDIYPPGEVSAHLYGSADGLRWYDLMQLRRISSSANTRADVYWELPSGELVLQVENVQGFGPGGKGYQLLVPAIR